MEIFSCFSHLVLFSLDKSFQKKCRLFLIKILIVTLKKDSMKNYQKVHHMSLTFSHFTQFLPLIIIEYSDMNHSR